MSSHPHEALLEDDGYNTPDSAELHELQTAPILTSDALDYLGSRSIPQTAVYGRLLSQRASGLPVLPDTTRVYINTDTPFSALVCGVQGSGKSHSTSVLLESCLITDKRLGTLPEPLSALVFHFDTAAGGGLVQPCEAAYLAALHATRGGVACAPPVKVLVLPNSLSTMQRVYAGLPGVSVEALRFSSADVNAGRLLSMMKVDEGGQPPLYIESILTLLRSMEEFDYHNFRRLLDQQDFSSGQRAMLNLRLALLDSCLEGGTHQNRVASQFIQGQLTIIDLSSPFMDGTSACGFFDLILGLFMESDCATGKIVVLDEAHKYLSEASSRLTESLLTVIRQQRHLGTRVVISTQEPTVVPPKFLDLCSIVIAHRFQSPAWLKDMLGHVAASDTDREMISETILGLRTGECVMIAPSGIAKRDSPVRFNGSTSLVGPIGKGYLVVRSRLRITRDGGHSLLASRSVDRGVSVEEPTKIQPTSQPSQPRSTDPDVPSKEALVDPWGGASNEPWTATAENTWMADPIDSWALDAANVQLPKGQPAATKSKGPSVPASGLPTPSSSTSHIPLPATATAPPTDKATSTLVFYLRKESASGTRVTWAMAKNHLFEKYLLKGGSGGPTARAKAIFSSAEQAGILKIIREGSDSYLELLS